MDQTPSFPALFQPIQDILIDMKVSPGDPTAILTALNAAIVAENAKYPEDHLDPIFLQQLTPPQQETLLKLNDKFKTDYQEKQKVALRMLDSLLPYMSTKMSKEQAGKIQVLRSDMSPFCSFDLFDLQNARDYTITDSTTTTRKEGPGKAWLADGHSTLETYEISHGDHVDVKTVLFNLQAPPEKKKRSKGAKKKQELKEQRAARPKKGYVKVEKPISKSQLKKQAQKEALVKARAEAKAGGGAEPSVQIVVAQRGGKKKDEESSSGTEEGSGSEATDSSSFDDPEENGDHIKVDLN